MLGERMIILTGASGGIGRAILPALTELDSVIAVYHSTQPELGEADGVTTYKVDLTSELEVGDFVCSIKDRCNKITLIHAAAQSRDGLAAKLSIDEWGTVIDVNLRGNYLLTRAMLLQMIAEKWGRIIHLSSIAGMRGMPGTLAYSTAKTGLLGMSRVLANEYARLGITSNVLVLGYFNTGLFETLSDKVRKQIVELIPSKRLGDTVNIVNAVDFLMKSDYVNGSTIHIDGGI